MELWIRSQNRKRLIKLDRIEYQERNGHYYIGICYEDYLGTYKTKERALEILDEIQNAIIKGGVTTEEYRVLTGSYHTIKQNVYEMPKE